MSLELNLRLLSPVGDLPQDLVPIGSEGLPNIGDLLFYDFHQEGRNLLKEGIAHVIVPGGDKDAVLWLQDEIVRNVIYNYRFVDVSAE